MKRYGEIVVTMKVSEYEDYLDPIYLDAMRVLFDEKGNILYVVKSPNAKHVNAEEELFHNSFSLSDEDNDPLACLARGKKMSEEMLSKFTIPVKIVDNILILDQNYEYEFYTYILTDKKDETAYLSNDLYDEKNEIDGENDILMTYHFKENFLAEMNLRDLNLEWEKLSSETKLKAITFMKEQAYI